MYSPAEVGGGGGGGGDKSVVGQTIPAAGQKHRSRLVLILMAAIKSYD